jgi:hypothetical protein
VTFSEEKLEKLTALLIHLECAEMKIQIGINKTRKKMKRKQNLRENYKIWFYCGGTFHTTSAHLETIMKCCRTPKEEQTMGYSLRGFKRENKTLRRWHFLSFDVVSLHQTDEY